MIDERGGAEPGLDTILAGVIAVRAELRRLVNGHIMAADKLENLILSVDYLSLSVIDAMKQDMKKAQQ